MFFMRVFTGDESGLVKSVVFPVKSEGTEGCRKRTKTEVKKHEPAYTVVSYGRVNKDDAVQKIVWGVLNGIKHIVVAQKSGKIQYISSADGTIVREYKDIRVGPEDCLGSFIGLAATDSHLMACSSTGYVSYTPLSTYSSSSTTYNIALLGDNLNVMLAHPIQRQLLATGGKERDLCIYDINAMSSPNTSASSGSTLVDTEIRKRKKSQSVPNGLVFQAKNVKNDFLDLRVPIWIRDLQFMNEPGTKIVTATQYHQIRLYDTVASRRPVLDIDAGKYPLTSIHIGRDYNHILYTDTMSNIGTVDIRTGRTVGLYKGFTGTATDLCVAPPPTFTTSSEGDSLLISVSTDGFLRIHEMTSMHRKLQIKAYLKHRLTCILLDEDYDVDARMQQNEEFDEEHEALWNALDTMAERPKRKHV